MGNHRQHLREQRATKMRDTSLEAYAEVKKHLGASQEDVLRAISKIGESCDKDVSDELFWSINRVTPRRGELLEKGLIVDLGKRPSYNGRTAHYWRVATDDERRDKQYQLGLGAVCSK